jgi:hypothetical protein
MPDTTWPEIGNTRQTHPGTKKKPRFRCHLYPFRHVVSDSLTFVFLIPI